jgi:hypothetical protein
MTVRECFWNADRDPIHPITWGASTTVNLSLQGTGERVSQR